MIQPQLTNLEERHELLLNRYKDLQNNINQRQETHFWFVPSSQRIETVEQNRNINGKCH